MLRNDLILEDTTLRDGEQAPGVAFSKEAKIKIYRSLVNAGVKWLEAGIPAMGGEELETVKIIRDLAKDDGVTTIAWNRGVTEDVKQSLDLGFNAVHIGLPTSNMHLTNSINKSRDWLIRQATDLIKLAKDRGAFVSISAEDVGRTEIDFLQQYATAISEAGADRLRLSDTVGILTPEKYANIIKSVKNVSDIDLQCHAHNDFGLAVANTLAGLNAGARYFHVTVNAIGERAGMPDLAQVTLALLKFYGVDLGIKTDRLIELSELVAFYSRTSIHPWQPVVGKNVFAHESGIHANGTIKCGEAFEPFSPEVVSGKRKIVIGKHSGRNAIKHVLEAAGVQVNESKLADCLNKVREKSIFLMSDLTIDQLLPLYHESREAI